MAIRTFVGIRIVALFSILVFVTSGCTIHATISDLLSTGTPVSKLVNAPSVADNSISLNVGVTGDWVVSYIYRLGVASSMDCSSESGYSSTQDIGAAIADSLAALPDGPLKLCVLGVNNQGLRQSLDNVTTAEWVKDTVPPAVTVTSPTTFIDASNKSSFLISGTCTENGMPVLISGSYQGSTTCAAGIWSKIVDLSTLPDGPVSFQVKQEDLAKNQHTVALAGIDKDEGATAEISVSSSFEKVAEGNQTIAFTIKTNVVKLYDTVVGYTLGGDAVAGTDYDFSAGTITIPAGQSSGSVNISIKENAVVGDVARLGVNIIEVDKPNVRIGAGSSKLIEIIDNDNGGIGLTIVDFVVGNGGNTCFVYSSGVLKCWGANEYGQLGDGTITNRTTPTSVNSAQIFKKVMDNGGPSTCGQTTSNKVYCWGWGGGGQLGNGGSSQQLSPTQVDGGAVYLKVETGGGQGCGINASSKLRCWGFNSYGQVGDNSTTARFTPVNVDNAEDYQAIGLGYQHSCAISSSGALKCWGRNQYGQLGDNSTTNSIVPKVIDTGVNYQSVSGSSRHTCGITSTGVLKCWGDNANGQLGDGTTTASLVPKVIDSGVSYSYVETDYNGIQLTCGITTAGILKCWGKNANGLVGDGSYTNRLAPVVVDAVNTYTKVSIGVGHACALTTGNTLMCWGSNTDGQTYGVPVPNATTPETIIPAKVWKTLSRGSNATCAIDSNDKLFCWGPNTHGQVGDGTKYVRAEPVPIMKDKNFISISTGQINTCAVDSNKKLYCWGEGSYGLGDGTTTSHLSPVLIDSVVNYSKVSVGDKFICALSMAQAIRCWGSNDLNQLGDGTTNPSLVPINVAGGLAFKNVSAGLGAACGIDSNDKLYCWGNNNSGQVGDGTTVNKSVPTAIDSANTYSFVSTDGGGTGSTCGILVSGILKCWGSNIVGQLGDGTTTQRTTPTTIGAATFKTVNVGNWSTCGVMTNDKLYCWGSNGSGQVGDGSKFERTSPAAVDSGNSYIHVETDGDTACGIRSNGSMYCWGSKFKGLFSNGIIDMIPHPAHKINYFLPTS